MTGSSTRPKIRRQSLSPLAIGLAIALHAVLFGIMFIKVDSHVQPVAVKALDVKPEQSADVIEATAIDNQELEKIKEEKLAIEREKQRKIEAEKKRQAEEKRKKEEQIKQAKAEEKRKQELARKKKAEQKKKAEEEKKRKAAEAKKKKEAERKKKLAAEQKRKEAAEKKRKEAAARKRKEAELKKQMEAKARAVRAEQAMSKYVPRIQQKVQSNWTYPPRGPEGCNPTVRVSLAPDGKVLNASIVKSSGDPYCDSSVEKAFLKASPIPIPLDPDLYSEFKTIDFPFRP